MGKARINEFPGHLLMSWLLLFIFIYVVTTAGLFVFVTIGDLSLCLKTKNINKATNQLFHMALKENLYICNFIYQIRGNINLKMHV